ncbi:Nucleotide-binding universal stress protein, UspA family [Halovenus aranensis]|jgi:nucleotide-binding universal stress UspA family protein|uniref:Nucleotide-binding universal stress protein, UspA family n=1 Tax=Halovenus aranensis TaxID=890420 RepID=A0A1G8X7V8_9EURY|nr:universal stress protein [Halovenus aranensis]SDJ85820.1 Nucleotide-binding universal stress protein, UspA family [Halovenus aranensis]
MTVLIAYDGSDPAQAAVEYAVSEHPEEDLVLLHTVEAASGSLDATVNMIQKALKDQREEVEADFIDEVTDLLADRDVEYTTEVSVGDPAHEVVDYAEEHDIDHIVVGNHGREGASRIFLGNSAEAIVRRSPVTVTVVRDEE